MSQHLAKTLCFLAGLYCPTLFALETYTLDPMHTYVLWHADHFGFSHPAGKWMANGTLLLDKKDLTQSQVTVTIQMATLDTAIPDLDKHLKGKLFFDVAEFPTATFISNKVEALPNQTYKIAGQLNLHGVTQPIVLEAKLNKMDINPINEQETIGFTAHTMLKRSAFGINTLLPGVSDDIQLEIEVEAYKANNGAKT